MKPTVVKLAAIAAITISLSACESLSGREWGQIIGTGAGIAVGSQIGSGTGRIIAMGVGAVAGHIIGGKVGQHLDQRDQERAVNNLGYQINRPGYGEYHDSWNSRQNGYPVETYSQTMPPPQGYGSNCKSYVQKTVVMIDGRDEIGKTSGVACQSRPGGPWEIVK